MAWQSPAAAAGNNGGAGGGGADGGNNGGAQQQQGTEYTLQGTVSLIILSAPNWCSGGPHGVYANARGLSRCDAISPDRMASA